MRQADIRTVRIEAKQLGPDAVIIEREGPNMRSATGMVRDEARAKQWPTKRVYILTCWVNGTEMGRVWCMSMRLALDHLKRKVKQNIRLTN
jgi:hypothetical protein